MNPDAGIATLLELRFPARPDQLRRVRGQVREQVEASGCSEPCASDIVMAVDEACQNIIRHAYAGREDEIVLRIERSEGELIFSVIDFAPRVDPETVRPRDLDEVRPGGLGTHLIRTVMDRVEFATPPPGSGNLLRMVKRIQ